VRNVRRFVAHSLLAGVGIVAAPDAAVRRPSAGSEDVVGASDDDDDDDDDEGRPSRDDVHVVGTKAIDVLCPQCGAIAGARCGRTLCRERIRTAQAQTRKANRQARRR
jgi:hypothetical protein